MSSKKSKKQEEKIAADFGGRPQVASGAFDFWDNDVLTKYFLIEAKYTEKKSFSIKRDYWNTVEQNAFGIGRLPVMVIEFLPIEKKLAVIRYEELLDYNNELGRYG